MGPKQDGEGRKDRVDGGYRGLRACSVLPTVVAESWPCSVLDLVIIWTVNLL